ncbi:hypothetical protein BJ085DRAFT_37952 [Dimargaris cristalligena]|uniref:Uncharacterized protein n=1 Tax=Dimargaris cristalligena TaxID=215637 RepID=A0A4P9ZZ16_9FUNG|nr:hypothetical protein BJ085DRAFT_37952 [Dimargaris cristalligena]|eukprot:RKP39005.1 hypothetical protein BJ085DRAFT_37952 [Dimargaris cristalligena]
MDVHWLVFDNERAPKNDSDALYAKDKVTQAIQYCLTNVSCCYAFYQNVTHGYMESGMFHRGTVGFLNVQDNKDPNICKTYLLCLKVDLPDESDESNESNESYESYESYQLVVDDDKIEGWLESGLDNVAEMDTKADLFIICPEEVASVLEVLNIRRIQDVLLKTTPLGIEFSLEYDGVVWDFN